MLLFSVLTVLLLGFLDHCATRGGGHIVPASLSSSLERNKGLKHGGTMKLYLLYLLVGF